MNLKELKVKMDEPRSKIVDWYYAARRFVLDIPQWPRYVKWFVQRGSRGWADSDVWSVDWYLLKILPPMLRRLKNTKNGIPAGIIEDHDTNGQAEARWDKVMDELIEGFELKKLWDDDYPKAVGFKKENPTSQWNQYSYDFDDPVWMAAFKAKEKEVQEKFNRSMDLLKTWFGAFWD